MPSTMSQAAEAMTKLSLDPPSSPTPPPSSLSSKAKPKPKKQVVADSWEDEESSASEVEAEPPTPPAQADAIVRDGFAAPPPTPISPTYGQNDPERHPGSDAHWLTNSSTGGGHRYRDTPNEDGVRRPEKTDAVARRMIASALGVRAPKQTEEQKAYDRAVRERERKRREEEREAERKRQEEVEKAKSAMWND